MRWGQEKGWWDRGDVCTPGGGVMRWGGSRNQTLPRSPRAGSDRGRQSHMGLEGVRGQAWVRGQGGVWGWGVWWAVGCGVECGLVGFGGWWGAGYDVGCGVWGVGCSGGSGVLGATYGEPGCRAQSCGFPSVQFSHSVVSNSLQPQGLQHARLPCPSPTPRAYSNSCPSRQ